MLHLPADRLAELVDIEPTAQELAHLQSCAACARERDAFRSLRDLAVAERYRASQPLVAWEALRRDLAAEGIIRAPAAAGISASGRSRGFTVRQWSMRAAAAVALVAGGAVLGRVSSEPWVAALDPEGATVTQVAAAEPARAFTSAADAMAVLMRAQEDYQRAAAFLLASDTTLGPSTPTMYKQRLAALDEVMGVTRSALTRAPQDPVINSYYLAALGAREATLQQLELALPEGTRIDRF